MFILDAYITQGTPPIDTILTPMGRDDYAAISDKTTPGTPSVYWFNRTAAPTLTLWAVPNSSTTWTLNYWRVRQLQDAALSNAAQPEIMYRFIDAFSWALSYRMAAKYAPDKAVALKSEATEAWNIATSADTENVPVSFQPDFTAYYG